MFALDDASLCVATFQAEVTLPLGTPLCIGNCKPVMEIVTPLTVRGVVLLGAGDLDLIVLCAFDWVGIGNESYDEFCRSLAEAGGTTIERDAVQTLNQHDAPGSDFAREQLLAEHGLARHDSNPECDAEAIERVSIAAKQSLVTAQPVSSVERITPEHCYVVISSGRNSGFLWLF